MVVLSPHYGSWDLSPFLRTHTAFSYKNFRSVFKLWKKDTMIGNQTNMGSTYKQCNYFYECKYWAANCPALIVRLPHHCKFYSSIQLLYYLGVSLTSRKEYPIQRTCSFPSWLSSNHYWWISMCTFNDSYNVLIGFPGSNKADWLAMLTLPPHWLQDIFLTGHQSLMHEKSNISNISEQSLLSLTCITCRNTSLYM